MVTNRVVSRVFQSSSLKTIRVVVYCRVSSNLLEQLHSLTNQVSYYTQDVYHRFGHVLVDFYIDIRSGSNTTERSEFQRMLEDSKKDKFDMIITKSISRFGRNTIETLDSINKLRAQGIEIYFQNDDLYAQDEKNILVIELMEAIAEEENKSRRENIRWGMLKGVESGNSKMFNRKCYGFVQNEKGELVIKEDEAEVVKLIYDLYLSGYSIVGIRKELKTRQIKSPTGRDEWSKKTLENILQNEKYTGDVMFIKTFNEGFVNTKRKTNHGEKARYFSSGNNPVIITKEVFDKVAAMRAERSNVTKDEVGNVRKSTRYSMKKTTQEPEK
ncbi:MAG: recombinase family protein [Erysipelotrichaceae bacterium]|nr:recombinase family protein [Erysipelotrichaceae bacterium]